MNQKILCALEKIIVYQKISSYSGKDCCVPESIVVLAKRLLMCYEKGCCVLEKVVVFQKMNCVLTLWATVEYSAQGVK